MKFAHAGLGPLAGAYLERYVYGSGFRVPGSGFRVPGSGFRVPVAMACLPERPGRKRPSAVRHVHAVCSNVLHDDVKEIRSRRNSKG